MLKWAVHGARQSYLQTQTEKTSYDEQPTDLVLPLRRQLKRKSSELQLRRRKLNWDDKENINSTSTPLHNTVVRNVELSPLRSLRDVSNIVAETIIESPKNLPKTPEAKPRYYSSTLPTFDVEYSPNGLIPGPILAMRGIGAPDSYFEKPRYLTQEDLNARLNVQKKIEKEENNKTKIKPKQSFKTFKETTQDSTLSSSRMGDLTLDRMIDAILESTRKERKLRRCVNLRAPVIMSPTYTPAEDPASDLHEYWDHASAQYKPTLEPNKPCQLQNIFNEREIRGSPSLTERLRQNQQKNSISFHLRRQRGVRRKRKIGKLNKSLRNSAQKVNKNETTVGLEIESTNAPTPDPPPEQNISPDSGHNSTSDLEEFPSADEVSLEPANVDNSWHDLDATKRRLNFSKTQSDNNTTLQD